MKRISAILLILVVTLIFSLAGCSVNDLEEYKEAVNKTNSITKGQLSYEISIEQGFNTDGLSSERINKLNYFKKVEAQSSVKFDDEKNKFISRNYSNFGGMGFDTAIYLDGEKVYMKMPIIGKYIIFDEEIASEKSEYNEMISQETTKNIINEWVNLLNTEDVVSGEKTLLNTEEGEVKTTLFTINASDKQIRELINKSLDIMEKDEKLKESFSEMIQKEGESVSIDGLINKIREKVNESDIKDFKYNVYIDIDGYIIQNNIEIEIEYPNAETGQLDYQKIVMQGENWDIEKEQDFKFPELNEKNIMRQENMEQGVPFIFEDLLKKEKVGE